MFGVAKFHRPDASVRSGILDPRIIIHLAVASLTHRVDTHVHVVVEREARRPILVVANAQNLGERRSVATLDVLLERVPIRVTRWIDADSPMLGVHRWRGVPLLVRV